ncbi:MAG: TlpA family protein disulfide reductase, partial [Planctomycetota bacterium]
MRSGIVLSVAVCLALASAAWGQRGELKVGDKAPGLDIDQWVKGQETAIQPGQVYVVEFWATWCVPCRKSIPHLTELQRQHGDAGLTIIGVSYEEPGVVEPFVSRQGDNMAYTVAVDRRSSTKRAWMDAAGRDGIPVAFIVDRTGTVAFIGHPLDEQFDGILKKVVANRYNPKLEREAEPIIAAARSARKVRNWRMARTHYESVVDLDPRVFANVAIELFEMK